MSDHALSPPAPSQPEAGRSPLEALADVRVAHRLLHDFVPLPESLDWRLGQFAWHRDGDAGFLRDEVPYVINNSGRLSDRAAALLFAALSAAPPSGETIDLLEIGAGTGLFAALLLRRFAELCERQGAEFHRRIRLHVTDASARTVAAWTERGQFSAWQDRVRPRVLDAADAGALPLQPFAVFANYVLDVLPARIVRQEDSGPEELCLRVHATSGSGPPGTDDEDGLADSLHATELEAAFRPCDPRLPWLAQALDTAGNAPAILNHAAIGVLLGLLGRLAPGGFVLINDYGPTDQAESGATAMPQRFGETMALGLNFPLVEQVLSDAGATVLAPDGDARRAIHTRLIAAAPPTQSLHEVFAGLFSAAADSAGDAAGTQARALAASGRRDEALDALRAAVAAGPYDWQLLGWAAEYVGLGLGNPGPGAELARAALDLNPWSSAWLWNVLGDCLFVQQAITPAEDAYRTALRIAPLDPRGNLNIAWTYALAGRTREALTAIAAGLAGDRSGEWRTRLLRKQAEVLDQREAARAARADAWSRRAMILAAASAHADRPERAGQ